MHTILMKAGIIGATGYGGAELVRLLSFHPKVDKLILSSVSFEGGKIETVYPNFLEVVSKTGKTDGSLKNAETVITQSDVIFSALPHAAGEPFAKACIEKGICFIDLSADFRFDDDEETYANWYGKPYHFPDLHKKSIYGLPEMNREKIKDAALNGAVIIGNPGCYPTGATLGVMPALLKDIVDTENAHQAAPIIVNAVSGTSGGGREPSRQFHFAECNDSVSAYKVASHRHSPEIERNFLSILASRADNLSDNNPCPLPKVIFTPHLAPMNRGILSTIYIPLKKELYVPPDKIDEKTNEIRKLYADFYKDEPFVRVLPEGITAATNRVRLSNYCDVSVHIDINGSTLIAITAIDNMVKGAAGQAVQNMNILFGFDEVTGLEAIPALF